MEKDKDPRIKTTELTVDEQNSLFNAVQCLQDEYTLGGDTNDELFAGIGAETIYNALKQVLLDHKANK